MDDSVDAQQRAKLLRLAVDQHRQYTNEARNPGVSYYSRQGWGEGGGGGGIGVGGGGVAGKCPAEGEAATTGSGSAQTIY